MQSIALLITISPSFATDTAKLVADLKKMKEESEAVLNEMAKMKEALASAQERYTVEILLARVVSDTLVI